MKTYNEFLNEKENSTWTLFYDMAKYDDKLTPEEIIEELIGYIKGIEKKTKSKTVRQDAIDFINAFRKKDKKTQNEILSKYKN